MSVFTTKETIANAVDTFYLDREGAPKLVPTGLSTLDKTVGGLGHGSCAILAAATGVGKSSTMLAAMFNSPVKVGAVCMEDTADIVGSRLLSMLTGVDSLRMRLKDLSPAELRSLNEAAKNPPDHMMFSYPTAGTIDRVERDIREMTKQGCEMIWVDYIQEIGGTRADRRNEVTEVLKRCHAAAAEGDAALIAISQFRRFGMNETKPGIHHLKESGDLENKARLIVLAHKVPGKDTKEDRVHFRLGKSNYGGAGTVWEMVRDESGTLQEAIMHTPEDTDDW